IPSAPRGTPQVEVTFDIDANGIVQVSAKDKATGKEQQIRIQASGGLSDADIQKMVEEAEVNAEEDKKRRELIEARNQADSMVHSTEKSLKEHGDKVSETERTTIEESIKSLKEILDGDDLAAIQEKTTALMQASMKLGEAIYKATQEQEAAAPSAETPAAEGTVVDAEFEDLDKDNRNQG
ncbi:MAG: Hsp70 family protein, partial [Alphaproteobacteria bacterium]